MTRRSYTGAAVATTLASPVTSSDTTGTLAATANLPTSNFVITVDQGLSGEEKILVGARTGTSLSGLVRGFDGTLAASHVAGASVLHTISATDLDEANGHVNDTTLHGPAVLAFTSISAAPTGTNHTGYADLDATNYKVTFTAPTSGKVLVRLDQNVMTATGGASATINLRVGGADVAGTVRDVVTGGTGVGWRSFAWLLTGLSGAVTLTVGHQVGASGSLFTTANSATSPSAMSVLNA